MKKFHKNSWERASHRIKAAMNRVGGHWGFTIEQVLSTKKGGSDEKVLTIMLSAIKHFGISSLCGVVWRLGFVG